MRSPNKTVFWKCGAKIGIYFQITKRVCDFFVRFKYRIFAAEKPDRKVEKVEKSPTTTQTALTILTV
jgi:hypothetical protein